jgi:toxin ParE1/3/4
LGLNLTFETVTKGESVHRRRPNLKVIWSRTALSEVERIFYYLADFNLRAARDVFDSLVETGNGLANLPYRGRPIRNGNIHETMTSYPYIVRYWITGDLVRILGVPHIPTADKARDAHQTCFFSPSLPYRARWRSAGNR